MTVPEKYKGYSSALAAYIAQAVGSIGCSILINTTSAQTTSMFWFVIGTAMSRGTLSGWRGGLNWRSLWRTADAYLKIGVAMAVGTLGWFVYSASTSY